MQNKQKDVHVPITIVGDKTISDIKNIVKEINSEHPKYIIILITELRSDEKSKTKWLELIERTTGWRLHIIEANSNTPPLLIDQPKKKLFISRKLLRLRYKQFIRLISHIVELLLKISCSTIQSVSDAVISPIKARINHTDIQNVSARITNDGLSFPTDIVYMIDEKIVRIVAVDHYLIVFLGKYKLMATVDSYFSLLDTHSIMISIASGFECQIPSEIHNQIKLMTELEFTVTKHMN